MLTRARAVTLVAEESGTVHGYLIILFSRASAHARIYSIAVDPRFRGRNIGQKLLESAELETLKRACISLRLEVRSDNSQAIRLYRKIGYRQFGSIADYYADHALAYRFEKSLSPPPRGRVNKIPYYQQTLDFTCGPAALIMAMKGLDPSMKITRTLEIDLWRESTTVFMTSGIGGCTPFGLTLAAFNRGFAVELFATGDKNAFADSVRSPVKKEVIRLVQAGFIQELKRLGIPWRRQRPSLNQLKLKLEEGKIPVVLISSYQIYQEKSPHWVVVTGHDDHFVYVHDPFVDSEGGESTVDSIHMPIPHRVFARMTRYGRAGLKAVLFIGKKHDA